jgi:hypothetical protein
MRQLRPRGVLERSVGADLFRHTLSHIPTVYGRIAYLASLRDPNSGTYKHHGLSASFGRDQTIKALEVSHTKSFREWLKLPLREKSSDLIEYLNSLGDPRSVVVRHWLRSRTYLSVIPDTATGAETAFYTMDIEALLSALSHSGFTHGADAGAPGPKSLPQK